MKIRIHTSAEAAEFLLQENRLFSAQFHSATNDGKIAIDVMFPPSADSETIAMAFFLAGQSFTLKQVKKIYTNENSLPTQTL
jgi:hypothetical protein